jgi:hypothetical protein
MPFEREVLRVEGGCANVLSAELDQNDGVLGVMPRKVIVGVNRFAG